jgi:replicative DNA helicase
MGQPTYKLRNIRKLLTTAFTDEELRRLCYDESQFRPVYEQFSAGMSKDQIVHRLLEYCERKGLLGDLLEIVQEENPAAYNKFSGKLVSGGAESASTTSQAIGSNEEIDQLQKLLTTNTRRLYKLQDQAAKYGLSTPPEIQIEIEDLEAEIVELKQKLNIS